MIFYWGIFVIFILYCIARAVVYISGISDIWHGILLTICLTLEGFCNMIYGSILSGGLIFTIIGMSMLFIVSVILICKNTSYEVALEKERVKALKEKFSIYYSNKGKTL